MCPPWTMIVTSKFRTMQYGDDDHWEDATLQNRKIAKENRLNIFASVQAHTLVYYLIKPHSVSVFSIGFSKLPEMNSSFGCFFGVLGYGVLIRFGTMKFRCVQFRWNNIQNIIKFFGFRCLN